MSVLLVCYDVCTTDPGGKRRYQKVARICQEYGVRAQYSVFECHTNREQAMVLRQRLVEAIDPLLDALRIYIIRDDDYSRSEHFGVRKPLDPNEPLIF